MTDHARIIAARSVLASQSCSSCPIRHRAICASCDDGELDRLDSIKSYRTWKAGETIAMAGDTLPFVGSIVDGCATLSRSMEDGRVQMVGLLMPSDFVGRPGRATSPFEVTSVKDTKMCLFHRAHFEQLLAETPNVARRMLQMSLDELDAARDWMVVLGRKTAREKVATFLSLVLRRASTGACPLKAELPLGREVIASFLGLTIETVSRQITALRRDGIIRLGETGRTILCDDMDALLAAAGDEGQGVSSE